MRKYHRWVMTVFGILLLYWSLSGLTLAIYDTTDPSQTWAMDGGGTGPVGSGATYPQLPEADFARLLNIAAAAANAQAPGAPITAMELRSAGGRLQSLVTVTGAHAGVLAFDALSGAPLSNGGASRGSLHNQLKNWHRGNIVGIAGVLLAIVTGCALLFLIVSGLVVYFLMWKARSRTGRQRLFWA